MCRVAEGAEIGIVRRLYPDAAPRANQPVKLLHGPDHIREVLDDVNRTQLSERVIRERIGDMVEVAQHIGMAVRIPVDADCARRLVDPATDVERPRLIHVIILPKLYNDGRTIANVTR